MYYCKPISELNTLELYMSVKARIKNDEEEKMFWIIMTKIERAASFIRTQWAHYIGDGGCSQYGDDNCFFESVFSEEELDTLEEIFGFEYQPDNDGGYRFGAFPIKGCAVRYYIADALLEMGFVRQDVDLVGEFSKTFKEAMEFVSKVKDIKYNPMAAVVYPLTRMGIYETYDHESVKYFVDTFLK